MELLANHWNEVDKLPKDAKEETCQFKVDIAGKTYSKTKIYKVFCPKSHDNIYDLVIQEAGKKYHFLVKKSEAKT